METGGEITEAMIASMAPKLTPVATAISNCRAALAADKALIGFAGAPWTIIISAGRGSSRDFATARRWMWENDVRFDRLLDLVSLATADFLTLASRGRR